MRKEKKGRKDEKWHNLSYRKNMTQSKRGKSVVLHNFGIRYGRKREKGVPKRQNGTSLPHRKPSLSVSEVNGEKVEGNGYCT